MLWPLSTHLTLLKSTSYLQEMAAMAKRAQTIIVHTHMQHGKDHHGKDTHQYSPSVAQQLQQHHDMANESYRDVGSFSFEQQKDGTYVIPVFLNSAQKADTLTHPNSTHTETKKYNYYNYNKIHTHANTNTYNHIHSKQVRVSTFMQWKTTIFPVTQNVICDMLTIPHQTHTLYLTDLY